MPTFETRCPNCKTSYTLDVVYQGRVGACRNCQAQFPLLPLGEPATKIMQDGPFVGDSSFSLASYSSEASGLSSDFIAQNPKTKTKTLSSTEVEKQREASLSIWKVGDILLGVYEVRPMPDGFPYAEGGVGIVHRVYHREWDIELAVKSPKPNVFQVESGKINYERECQTWIELGIHPNIVTCYLVRRIDGIPRLFAELVPDGSLNDWIRDGRLYHGTPEEKTKRLFDVAIQFAWGLDYSHKQGVLHLDIKPANVMLAGSRVKVTDFGLARAITVSEPGGAMQWEGMTPGYCSPEQYEAFLRYKAGEKQGGPPVSAKSDIWSWAISVLAMFHGRAPCKKGGQTANKVFEQYIRTVHAEYKPKMPLKMMELLQHCFQVKSEDRPDSMDEVADRLVEMYQETFQEKYPRSKPPMTVSTVEVLNNRAASLLDLHKPQEATALFSEAFRQHPWQPQVTFNQAIHSWRSAQWTDLEMLRQLESLVHLKPNDPVSHYAFGLAQRERGNLGEAKRALQRAVEIEPKIEYRRHLKAVDRIIDQDVRCLERYQIHSSETPIVLLSEDERLLLCCPTTDTITICETKTGRLMIRFRRNDINLTGEISAGQKAFSILSEDMHWELKQENDGDFVLFHLKNHGNVLTFKPISWNTSPFLGGMQVRDHKLFTTNSKGKFHPLVGHEGAVLSACSTSDRTFGVSGGADRTVRLWEIKRHQCVRTFRDGEGLVKFVYLSSDRSFVLSLADRSILKLWKTNLLFNEPKRVRAPIMLCLVSSSEEVSQKQEELSRVCTSAKLAANEGDYAGTLQYIEEARELPGWEMMQQNTEKKINIWEMVGRYCIRKNVAKTLCRSTFQEHEEIVSSVAISSDGKTAVSAGRDHTVIIWNTERKVCAGFLEGHYDWVRSVDITSDGRFAVSASWDQSVRLWDIAKREQIRVFDERIRSVGQVTFSPDGRLIAASSAIGRIFLFDALSGNKLADWQSHQGPIQTVRFTRDGQGILSAGEDGKAHLWDPVKKEKIHSLETHHCPVMAAVISTDRSRIISAGNDGSIHFCQLTDEKVVPKVFKGHLGAVTALTMTADDRWLISGSKDATIRFWNLETGESLKPLTLHCKQITGLAIDLVGSRLASSSEDQTLRIWDVEWNYEFPGWLEFSPLLDAYLSVLLKAHLPDSVGEITEQLFWRIRTELEYRGFGWIRPETLWTKLHLLNTTAQ